jgi:hypothetical protein
MTMKDPNEIHKPSALLGDLAAKFIELLEGTGPTPSLPCGVAVVCFSRMPDGQLAIGASATVPPDTMQDVFHELVKRKAVLDWKDPPGDPQA